MLWGPRTSPELPQHQRDDFEPIPLELVRLRGRPRVASARCF